MCLVSLTPAYTTIIWFIGIGLIGNKLFIKLSYKPTIYIAISMVSDWLIRQTLISFIRDCEELYHQLGKDMLRGEFRYRSGRAELAGYVRHEVDHHMTTESWKITLIKIIRSSFFEAF